MTFIASGACTSGGLNGATITILALGSCTITASEAGSEIYNAAADVVRTFAVVDTTAPAISAVTPDVRTIWPPNKRMVPVALTVAVSDVGDAAPVCQVTGVSSNEPEPGDSTITGALSVSLLANRIGGGSGRLYTIGIRCVDASGNAASSSTIVTVPHDQAK